MINLFIFEDLNPLTLVTLKNLRTWIMNPSNKWGLTKLC